LSGRAAAWLSQRVAGLPPGWLLIAGYEGNIDAVHWQVQQLIRELRGGGALEARVGATAAPLWHALAEFPLADQPGDVLTFKANLLPSATAALCRQIDAIPERPCLQAHAGNGIVIGHVSGLTPER